MTVPSAPLTVTSAPNPSSLSASLASDISLGTSSVLCLPGLRKYGTHTTLVARH